MITCDIAHLNIVCTSDVITESFPRSTNIALTLLELILAALRAHRYNVLVLSNSSFLNFCVNRRTATSLVTPIGFLGRRINLCKTHRRYGEPSYKIRRASINARIIGHRLNPPSLPVVNTWASDFECGLHVYTYMHT